MRSLVAEDLSVGLNPPTQILLKLDTPNRKRWRSSDILSPTIARVWLQRDDVSFRLLPWYVPPDSAWASWWPIRFGPDAEGVGNAKVGGGIVPYDELRILSINGRSAQRLTHAARDDFAGYDVQWNRVGPIALPSAGGSPRLTQFAVPPVPAPGRPRSPRNADRHRQRAHWRRFHRPITEVKRSAGPPVTIASRRVNLRAEWPAAEPSSQSFWVCRRSVPGSCPIWKVIRRVEIAPMSTSAAKL